MLRFRLKIHLGPAGRTRPSDDADLRGWRIGLRPQLEAGSR